MRSLAVLDVGLRPVVDAAQDDGIVCAITPDPASLALYALAQQPQPDGTATLLLYSLPQTAKSGVRPPPPPLSPPAPRLMLTPSCSFPRQ